jgi:hypothetical protein
LASSFIKENKHKFFGTGGPQNFGRLYIIDILGQPLADRFAFQALLKHINSSHLHLDTWEQSLFYLSLSSLSVQMVVRLMRGHTLLCHTYLKLQYQEISGLSLTVALLLAPFPFWGYF